MTKTLMTGIFTITEFADVIGSSRQWILWKVKEAQTNKSQQITFYMDKDITKPVETRLVFSDAGTKTFIQII